MSAPATSPSFSDEALAAMLLLCITNIGWLGMLASGGLTILATEWVGISAILAYCSVGLPALAVTWGVLFRYVRNEERETA